MANYKSQFTGEQIDEAVEKALGLDVTRILSAVEKVETAPNIYNYDGTVIIEKAESVLGLRKLKANYTPLEFTWNNQTDEELFNLYGFSIDSGDTAVGATCILITSDLIGDVEVTQEILIAKHLIDGVYEYFGVTDFEPTAFSEAINQFINDGINITSTNNTTVDEWLLANTEGVSV